MRANAPGPRSAEGQRVQYIGPAAERIIRCRASDENQRLVSELLEREKTSSLSAEETAELDRYLQFDHVVRLAKARAQLYLQEQASGGAHG